MSNRLIVISNERDLDNEASMVLHLFDEGLSLFHLRKPGWTIEQQRRFLTSFSEEHLGRISVHQHYSTVKEFGLRYCHFPEHSRTKLNEMDLPQNVSTSFHAAGEVTKEAPRFTYAFFGPVRESLSKPGYGPAQTAVVPPAGNCKLFALGGITPENAVDILNEGYDGVAILGSIWLRPEHYLLQFKKFFAIVS